jgi:hypothetical protein
MASEFWKKLCGDVLKVVVPAILKKKMGDIPQAKIDQAGDILHDMNDHIYTLEMSIRAENLVAAANAAAKVSEDYRRLKELASGK